MRRTAPAICLIALLSPIRTARAEAPAAAVASANASTTNAHRYTVETYLRDVAQGNLDLAAQRFNVSIAQAQISIAKVFPDPILSGGLLQYDVTQQGNPTGTIVALTVPIQIAGQRGARVDVAEAGLTAANADLEDFFRTLRATAANGFVDALHARQVLERRKQTLASLERLVTVNQTRLKAGDVGESVLVQSRVEAQQFRAQVLDSEGGVKAADILAEQYLGPGGMGQAIEPTGDLRATAERSFDAGALVALAMKNRPDLRAAERRKTQAEREISLVRRNRVMDIAVGASWQHYFATTIAGTPIPSSDWIGATLTLPLPFSRIYHGDLDAAYAAESQSEQLVKAAQVKIETEVRQAVARYDAAAARVKLYTTGVLSDADSVLDKTMYDYQRGGATLVEVLVAQRTVNDVYLSYYDALADSAHALIAVEQAVGSWDVSF